MNSFLTETWDAVVIGTGIAGLTAALSLEPLRTLVITKVPQLAGGSSHWAQGGIAFPVNAADESSHKQDTLISAAGSGNPAAVEALVGHALEARDWLESQGVHFDRTGDGAYILGREGAHSIRRIYHAHGDATGQEILQALLEAAARAPHITLRTGVFAWDLEVQDQQIQGLWALDQAARTWFLQTPRVLLAGGGLGQLFGRTTNPPEATGDAMAMAVRADLELQDMEMIQFHPTGLASAKPGERLGQYPLISEAVRGEGAVLVTADGAPLAIPHPLGSLGPRDIVARAVFQSIQSGIPVFLDAREAPGPEFEQHFPTVFHFCQEGGLDPRRDLIPVAPVVHYTMGGIPVDQKSRTALPGLWALGESSCTGVHGANRLASNSLLECVVFSRLAAPGVRDYAGSGDRAPGPSPLGSMPSGSPSAFRREVQDILFTSAGPVRTHHDLARGWDRIQELTRTVETLERRNPGTFAAASAWKELENLVLLGGEVLKAALANPESRGAHFLVD